MPVGLRIPVRDGVAAWRRLVSAGGRRGASHAADPHSVRQRAGPSTSSSRARSRRGYAVVVSDVRGRYSSDGDFDPYRHEGFDGYDTIEWVAAQPWSSGRCGATAGLSYPGAVQWLAAVESPPHLVCAFPAMSFSSGRAVLLLRRRLRLVVAAVDRGEHRGRGSPKAGSHDRAAVHSRRRASGGASTGARRWRGCRFVTSPRSLALLRSTSTGSITSDDGPYWRLRRSGIEALAGARADLQLQRLARRGLRADRCREELHRPARSARRRRRTLGDAR